MLPRNAIAIRKTLGAATRAKIITAATHKTSTATLLDYPPGAYTGMRTFDKLGIMDFTGHTTRLANSLQQIHFPGQGAETSVVDSNVEAAAATKGLAPLRSLEVMKEETMNLVKAGLKFYYKNRTDDVLGSADETKVTVLCTWDPENQEPTLIAHFEPLKTPTTLRCKVEVHGSPRHHATAKDSQWVKRDRRGLEASLDKDSNEALLVDNSTQDIYEGLSSNFFAFDRARRTILTAPLNSVLQGTILKVVMNVCNNENIPVEFKFPNLKEAHEWEGAFITSTSRLVLPIEKLVMPDGNVKGFEPSPTIELIRREVLEECRRRVEPILTKEDI
ncbi:hypothetical protein BGZ90_011841 [Linnemannia elongata]|nr:hypothetical protein BGZ90_011841 [Linnemannia elongata]